jgi:hypothetical protein
MMYVERWVKGELLLLKVPLSPWIASKRRGRPPKTNDPVFYRIDWLFGCIRLKGVLIRMARFLT